MNSQIKTYLLEKTISWLLGGQVFNEIKNLVSYYFTEDIPGEEKRAEVQKRIKKMFGNVATFLINLGIEAAVVALKAKKGEL